MALITIDPKNSSVPEVYKILSGGIAPRPIALVSTLSVDEIPNLAPFSFFNCFGANPPVVAFSATRRGADASFKDTYSNLIASKECVISSVCFSMVEQMNVASTEYAPGVDEFTKSGFTPVHSRIVKPFCIKESPFQMECKLVEMVSVGSGRSSANIAICEVVLFHMEESIFENGIIHPDKIDLVSRMSGSFYCRAIGGSIFEVPRAAGDMNIGFDGLPEHVKNSNKLSGNELGKLAALPKLPNQEEITAFYKENLLGAEVSVEGSLAASANFAGENDFKKMLLVLLKNKKSISKEVYMQSLEQIAKTAIKNNELNSAIKVLLLSEFYNISF